MEISFVKVSIRVLVEPDEDGSYHAFCPELKGLHTSGATKQEAADACFAGAKIYIDSLIRRGKPIPVGIVEKEYSSASLVAVVKRWFKGRSQEQFSRELELSHA